MWHIFLTIFLVSWKQRQCLIHFGACKAPGMIFLAHRRYSEQISNEWRSKRRAVTYQNLEKFSQKVICGLFASFTHLRPCFKCTLLGPTSNISNISHINKLTKRFCACKVWNHQLRKLSVRHPFYFQWMSGTWMMASILRFLRPKFFLCFWTLFSIPSVPLRMHVCGNLTAEILL